MTLNWATLNYFVDPKTEFDAVGSFVSNYSLLNCVRFVPLIVIYVRVLYPVVSNSVDSRNTLIGILICFDPKRSTFSLLPYYDLDSESSGPSDTSSFVMFPYFPL